ncbi:baseplate J/gp47 family protein [Methylobacterium sp. NPDC080182]|uniref:baseplate J/gp47 family protein n=1 Tax=Methylobacterium sp. NPDC080182 TaxID=3390590 RepID=UPI003CFDCC1E
MTSSSVPAPTFGTGGFIAPLESDILAGRIADFQKVFGGNLNPDLVSPQGQLAMSDTAIIGAVMDMFLFYTSQVDPAFSQGRMQDGIGRIYFIERNPAQPTTVQCTVIGAQGVTIPYGALAQDASGNTYICTQPGTFDATGTMTLTFANQAVGPIPCPAGTLTTIYQAIPGWDTITNPADGVPGTLVESRTAFEARRRLAVAQNSLGSIPSVLGAVLNVDGVTDAFVTENSANSPQVIGGVSLAPNSLYVAVTGGAAADIARAIWTRKAPGTTLNGNTSVQIQDTQSGYVLPYPTYSVSFTRPSATSVYFSVILANSAGVPADAAIQVQNAIIAAFAGLDGGPRARIASTVFASRFYPTVAALGSWAKIVEIKIGSINTPSASFVGSISGNVLTVASVTSGALAVGQVIDDATGALVEGTSIIALGTGTGGAGTYTVSSSQTVGTEAMIAAVASQDRVQMNLNQIPTVSASDITVTLA